MEVVENNKGYKRALDIQGSHLFAYSLVKGK